VTHIALKGKERFSAGSPQNLEAGPVDVERGDACAFRQKASDGGRSYA
jgi:hypothetical protein